MLYLRCLFVCFMCQTADGMSAKKAENCQRFSAFFLAHSRMFPPLSTLNTEPNVAGLPTHHKAVFRRRRLPAPLLSRLCRCRAACVASCGRLLRLPPPPLAASLAPPAVVVAV